MVLEKNAQLITTVCKVRIRSTDGVADIPTLQEIYHTPSKIKYSVSSKHTAHGNLHSRSLRLSYPGLSAQDFLKFDELLRGVYQIFIQLNTNEVYEVASVQFPMACETRFNIESGHELVFSNSTPFNQKFIGVEDGDSARPGLVDEQFDYDFDFNLA